MHMCTLSHIYTHMHTADLMDTLSPLCIGNSRAMNSVEASQGTENKTWMSNCHPAPSLPPSQDFVVGLSILLRGTVQEKLKWAFNLYDINKDGYITREVRVAGCGRSAAAWAVLHSFSSQRQGRGQPSRGSLCPGLLGVGIRVYVSRTHFNPVQQVSSCHPCLWEGLGDTQVEKLRGGLALAPTNRGAVWSLKACGDPHPKGPQLRFLAQTYFVYERVATVSHLGD